MSAPLLYFVLLEQQYFQNVLSKHMLLYNSLGSNVSCLLCSGRSGQMTSVSLKTALVLMCNADFEDKYRCVSLFCFYHYINDRRIGDNSF